MTLDESYLGWFYIDEVWKLYIENHLTARHVEHLHVGEHPENDDEYIVKHFSTIGNVITTLTLDADDLRDTLDDAEATDRPNHIP